VIAYSIKMVKLIALSLAVIAILAPIASARECKRGVIYCRSVLTQIGEEKLVQHDRAEEAI